MKKIIILTTIGIFLLCNISIKAQETQPNEIMDELIEAIHSRIINIKNDYAWLSEYNENRLNEEPEKLSIFYMQIKKVTGNETQLQQPSQIFISYIPINSEKRFKYNNAVEEVESCSFPKFGFKIYAGILIRENEKLAATIKSIIVEECNKLHKKLAANNSIEGT